MERIGTGKGVAALLNGRAKRVTARVVHALQRALPHALVLVSEDLEQARRHARHIVAEKPELVLSGGGDGAVVRLLNFLREEGAHALPPVGVLKLGTGNGWSRVTGAPPQDELVKLLPRLPRPIPTLLSDLVEVEETLCHFAGVGWDAKILNDYLRNLDKRSSQLIGSSFATRLHKGVGGYLYSVLRYTVPEEFQALRTWGQPRVQVENRGGPVFRLDATGALEEMRHAVSQGPAGLLLDGPLSVGGAATTPEFGYGFRAFPFARTKPGFINVRVYDRPVLEAVRNAVHLWRGRFPQPGMHDFFATAVQFTFERPMPFQIGGDGVGLRDEISFRVAKETVPVVDWKAAIDASRAG